MNKQKPPKSIEWTRCYGRDGYTWNPIGGCFHDCKWTMPDGTIATCYAKTIAEKFNQAYKHGFEYHYWNPERLQEPLMLKTGAGIFLDSMSDAMGHWVPDEQIQAVLDVCKEASHHIFFLLTKNAPRLPRFEYPPNVWVGVSSPPDFYMGKQLSLAQKYQYMKVALESLARTNATVKWMSFEPLSTDYSEIVAKYPVLNWSVIGAASQGAKYIPPNAEDFNLMLDVLDKQNVPVFFKGNMKSLPDALKAWREAFPPEVKAPAQMELF